MEQFSYNELLANYDIRRLQQNEKINAFDCGDADLNDFIINEAHLYRNELIAVSYVLENKTTKDVTAYFSLANDRVSVTDFESSSAFNRFRRKRFAYEKRLRTYPAVKICRLAVAQSMRGKAIGSFLIDFIKSYFLVDNKTGCRFVTVDAYLDAVPFYERNDFSLLKSKDEDLVTRLLFFDLASAK